MEQAPYIGIWVFFPIFYAYAEMETVERESFIQFHFRLEMRFVCFRYICSPLKSNHFEYISVLHKNHLRFLLVLTQLTGECFYTFCIYFSETASRRNQLTHVSLWAIFCGNACSLVYAIINGKAAVPVHLHSGQSGKGFKFLFCFCCCWDICHCHEPWRKTTSQKSSDILGWFSRHYY